MNETSPSKDSLQKQILIGFTNWALFLAGAVNLGVGTWPPLATMPLLRALR